MPDPAVVRTHGRFAKDRFCVDLDNDTVCCPAGVTVSIRRGVHGDGIAYFAQHCATCALRGECTHATGGRTIRVTGTKPRSRAPGHVRPSPTGKPTTDPIVNAATPAT